MGVPTIIRLFSPFRNRLTFLLYV